MDENFGEYLDSSKLDFEYDDDEEYDRTDPDFNELNNEERMLVMAEDAVAAIGSMFALAVVEEEAEATERFIVEADAGAGDLRSVLGLPKMDAIPEVGNFDAK